MTDLAPTGIIDYLVNCFLPEKRSLWEQGVTEKRIPLRVRTDPEDSFVETPEMIRRMDELGIATLMCPTIEDGHQPSTTRVVNFEDIATSYSQAEAMHRAFPGRIVGLWVLDPELGMDGVRRAAEILTLPWMVGMYIHTHSWDRGFDHPDYYPYYAVADEHRVPVVMQAGMSGGRWPSACGHPIGIDRPAIYFPDVDFVLSHTGWPWVEEAIAMAMKFDNVYIGTGSWPADHWGPALVDFIRKSGRRKTIFGTNFPTVGHRHALTRLSTVELSDAVRHGLLEGNARDVFRRLGGDAGGG